jgi:deoxyribodipyrimidine photo-lyase
MTTIAWIRRDMRLHDHAVLATALDHDAPVQPVFIFDTNILERFDNPLDRRVNFLARTLCHMHAQLKARDGGMLVLHGNAAEIIPKLAATLESGCVVAAEDFEPATRTRDDMVKAALPDPCALLQPLDHMLISPKDVLKKDGEPYKVFTPYYKEWLRLRSPDDTAEYAVKDAGRYAHYPSICKKAHDAGLSVISVNDGPEAVLEAIGYRYQPDTLWSVDDAQARLAAFIEDRLRPYPQARNFLPADTTSKISPYLRFGLVSVRECVRAAEEEGGGEKWVNELCWREFYMAILYHFPHVVEKEFQEQYQHKIDWKENDAHYQAFIEGKTGYPVVDAAVRELTTTGYMHNRSRMIVASFFTKDLFMDWRKGEAFFAQHLMDYELSSNNGGWQWASSTGTDAAPYFRIFNPVLQSKKFDENGEYIKSYVPELRRMPAKEIHAPWEAGLLKPEGYPDPIIDHKTAKDHAVGVFKALGHKMG